MATINIKETGIHLKKVIEQYGYTVKEIKELLGLSTTNAIYKWLKGENLPTVDNLVILADTFNVTVDELLIIEK